MKRVPLLMTLIALGALGVALFFWLDRGQVEAPDPYADQPAIEDKQLDRPDQIDTVMPKGGVYGGIVVDAVGEPLEGATVMLVAFNTGEDQMGPRTRDGPLDLVDIPVIGGYRIGGRDAKTDAKGRFTIPADSRARISHALSYHHDYFLNVVEVRGGPNKDIVIPLKKAGKVIGRVVDHKTGRPVPRVRVDVFLQQPTAAAPEFNPRPGGYNPGQRGKRVAVSGIASLGHFIAKELGQRIWGIPYQGTEALRFSTDQNGEFRLGPLGEGVQLEFVVTHPDYIWYDFDSPDGKRSPVRTRVGPGETVEREFRMREGLRISGRLIDDDNQPLADAVMSFESITQYHRHWWDASGKKRITRTERDGTFTMGGLAVGDHNIYITHPSFGKHWVGGVLAPQKNKEIVVARRGRLVATVTGLAQRPAGGAVFVNLEPRGEKRNEQDHLVRKRVRLDRQNRFALEELRPGAYELWVQSKAQASQPIALTIAFGEPVTLDIPLGGGGLLEVRLQDDSGGVVDPGVIRLIRVGEGAVEDRMLGRFASREGWVLAENLVPGRYRLQATAHGHMPAESKEIEIVEGARTDAGVIVLKAWAWLRISSIRTDRGKVPKTKTTVEWRPEPTDGDAEPERWRPMLSQAGLDLTVPPGVVVVRARTEDGLRFEQRFTLTGGDVAEVDIVLQ